MDLLEEPWLVVQQTKGKSNNKEQWMDLLEATHQQPTAKCLLVKMVHLANPPSLLLLPMAGNSMSPSPVLTETMLQCQLKLRWRLRVLHANAASPARSEQ